MQPETGPSRAALAEVGRYFFTLGCIAFGGPAAHIAIMRRELVRRRKWISDEDFVDLLGVTNLIPGPNSTELTMHLGARRAGWWGLWLGGAAFIFPAVVIVLAFAWAYVEYGDTPAAEGLLLGVQPVILAVIVQALWGLRSAVVKGWETMVVGVAAVALAVMGVTEVFIIFGAGGAIMAWRFGRRLTSTAAALFPLPWLVTSPPGYSHLELFLVFLKIGALLYGSGYVLISFMETDFVTNRGWVTEQQLVDAVAVGQFTPGPLFSSATFLGYLVGSWQGAAVATAAIFIPSFVFVAITHPLVPRLRKSTWASAFLDGVNVAAVALIGVVVIQLGREVVDDWFGITLLAAAAVVLLVRNPNSALVVLAGAAAGLAKQWVS